MKQRISSLIAVAAVGLMSIAPMTASAQHRHQTKEQWKEFTIGSAALGALVLLSHNGTLTTLGIGGALYSAYRYDQDRRSSDPHRRRVAAYYSRTSFTHNGHRYERRLVTKNHKKYYTFVRVR